MAFDHTNSNAISNLLADSARDNNDLLHALESFLETYKKQQNIQKIPISLFKTKNLGILEVLVKYLKESSDLSFHDIGIILNRDERTIWASYKKASKKHGTRFSNIEPENTVAIAIFSDRSQAPLEALIMHLKSKGLSFKQISGLIDRNYKTVWLTYNKKRHK